MVTVYVCSSESFAGKSTTCLVLNRHFTDMGLKVGYFKPVGTLSSRIGGITGDEDASFIAQEIGIDTPPDILCPVLLTPEGIRAALTTGTSDFTSAIAHAYRQIAADKDVVIASGVGSACCTGAVLGLSASKVIHILGAKALLMGKYANERSLDMILAAKDALGDTLMGTILNRVPPTQLDQVKQDVVPFLENRSIPVFGIIPLDTVLNATTVRELAEMIEAKVVSGAELVDTLIEQFSVGAMNVESALRHFRRIANKAVITGGDRSDIQLAALETSTRCLVLTGGFYPDARILGRAQELGVPVLLTSDDTLTTVEKIERKSGKLRVREPQKIARASTLAAEHVDLQRLDAALGIGKQS